MKERTMPSLRTVDEGPAKLLVVDDQELYRAGLIALLEHWDEFQIVGDASNGREAVDAVRKLRPDLVLMDLQMPEMNGIEATALITEDHPEVRVIMLTVSVDEESLFESLRSGASGYVLKDTSSEQLRKNLLAAMNGDMVLSERMGERLIKRLAATQDSVGEKRRMVEGVNPSVLTEREIELLKLVAQGLSNDEIGAQMYVSFGTVKKNLQTVMKKLQLPNRVMLAVYAVRAGFMNTE